MLSDIIEHRYKKIRLEDVVNLKFALSLIESGSTKGTNVTMSSSHTATPVSNTAPNNLSLSLDKSSTSIKNFDGHFDKSTRKLVRTFKKREGLQPDSRVDRDTWDCIIEAAIEKARKHSNITRFQMESIQELKEDDYQANADQKVAKLGSQQVLRTAVTEEE